MSRDFYPKVSDDDFMSKIYKKREYHSYRFPKRKEAKDYATVKNLRDKICNPDEFTLQNQQVFLKNIINPDTPYTGC